MSGNSLYYAEQFVNLRSGGTLKVVGVNSSTVNSQSYCERPLLGSTADRDPHVTLSVTPVKKTTIVDIFAKLS